MLNIHREGLLLAPTLRSLRLARSRAEAAGCRIELVVVADRPDDLTLAVLERHREAVDRLERVDFGDLGAARAHGIAAAAHDWVFMHDGDDLFSSNWYAAFFRAAAEGRIAPGTVHHTEIFARFGDILDLRRMIASDDPRFHPLFLASEWYFSNKAVLDRGLLARFPLPRNSVATGIGNEDWTWSCDTIHGGVRHGVLPETACFYRVKPQALSLGLTPGMIHGPSPLFDPENVAALARARGREAAAPRSFAPLLAGAVEPRIGETPVPAWFWEEVRVQGAFESLVTEFAALRRARRALPLPNLHYNVASATEYLFAGMDARPKIFLFAALDALVAGELLVEALLGAAAAHEGGRYQPVLVLDDAEAVASEARIAAAFGAKVISTRLLRTQYRIADWYFARFLMRPLVQFPGAIVIDTGSRSFAELFREFHRTILAGAAAVRPVFLEAAADPFSPAFNAIARNGAIRAAHEGGPVPVTIRPEAAPLFPGPVWSVTVTGPEETAALDALTRRRFADGPRPAPPRLAALLAPGTVPPCAERPALPPGAERRRLGTVERTDLGGGGAGPFLYRAEGASLPRDWPERAAALLAERPEVGLVLPQVTADLLPDGTHLCHWLDLAAPELAAGAMFERLMRGLAVPVAAVLRAPLEEAGIRDAAGLARALHRAVRARGLAAAAAGETLAVARDLRLHPEPGPAAEDTALAAEAKDARA